MNNKNDFQKMINEKNIMLRNGCLHQTKNFCTRETINKIKKQPTDWQKIIANDTSDMELLSKFYKELRHAEGPRT